MFLSSFPSIKSYLIQRKYSYKNGRKGVKTGNKDDKWLAVGTEKEMGRQKENWGPWKTVQMFVKLSTWKCLCVMYGKLSWEADSRTAFHGNRKFVVVYGRARQISLSWARLIHFKLRCTLNLFSPFFRFTSRYFHAGFSVSIVYVFLIFLKLFACHCTTFSRSVWRKDAACC